MNCLAQRECLVMPDLYTRLILSFMPVFIYGSVVLNLLTGYNLIFRGIALAQKTQVMFFGFWWKNVFSAVRPGKSATRREWITWCSYLWPWRQQPTRVMVPKRETSSVLSFTWKPLNWRGRIWFSHCQVVSGVDPAQMVSGLHVSFPRFLSPHVISCEQSLMHHRFLLEGLWIEPILVPINLTNWLAWSQLNLV